MVYIDQLDDTFQFANEVALLFSIKIVMVSVCGKTVDGKSK